jgi:hypothetical protein
VDAAKGPALAIGAAAAGFAGGAVLMKRRRTRRILGIKVPRQLVPKPSLNGGSLVKQVAKASKQAGKTGQDMSKDLERLSVQAERIGKVLD